MRVNDTDGNTFGVSKPYNNSNCYFKRNTEPYGND